MGAWDPGSFDNDDALDWIEEFKAEGMPAAGGAVQYVLDLDAEYLEAPICARALAAAEVIAAARGRPAPDLPEEIAGLLRHYQVRADPELVANARRAVEKVAAESELEELWAESELGPAWRAAVSDLAARLASAASPLA